MNSVTVDPTDVREAPVDSKGRVSVGTDYAGETVRVAVIEVVGDDDGPAKVTVCEDCGEIWAGLTTYCDDCGSEMIRQVEPRESDE